MSNNAHGFSNERSIVNYLNGKKIKDLNQNMRRFINWLFNGVNENTSINSGLVQKPIGERKNPKPDIWIRINNITRNISIKEGLGNSVHQESLLGFCDFLKTLNISTDIINDLKLYHFGDDTLDGSGEVRLSLIEVKEKYKLKITKVNNTLNDNIILENILNRILFDGTLISPISADVCYHGDYNNGIWASKNEIMDYLKGNIPENMSGIMLSKLTYQPWTRNENGTAKHPERRFIMQVKWSSMYHDLRIIVSRRDRNAN